MESPHLKSFAPTKPKPVVGPRCNECGKLMMVTRVMPHIADHTQQYFECPKCQHTKCIVVADSP
jgi:hypothetical protein